MAFHPPAISLEEEDVVSTGMLDFEDMAVFLHFVIFFLFFFLSCYIFYHEYQNATEIWIQSGLKQGQDNDDNETTATNTAWKEEEANRKWTFSINEPVVHADLGRGHVTQSNANHMDYVLVSFDILNDVRQMYIKDLLFVGMRLRHNKRGLGTLTQFDSEERAHVTFDNGEYHRYQYSAWKRKMHASNNRIAMEQRTLKKSFRVFIQEYLLYRIDYMLSTFTFAKPLVLLMTTYTLIVLGGTTYSRASGKSTSESLWIAWTMVADPGTHSNEEGTWQRVVALALSLGGMFVFALMIGIIADGVSSLLDDLKQGHSFVIETNHTLILGWSDKTLPFVREICLANDSAGGGVIVILAERPKIEMENDLHLTEEESRNTLVICRSGNPTVKRDLRKVSAGSARSVVILANRDMDADESDAKAVRCILSLQGVRKPKMGHIVVEMCDVDNRELGLLADGKNVEVVVAHDLIGRFMIQCAREPGLAQILEELLGFEGDEFYLKAFPELTNVTFGEVLFRFEDAVPLGVKPKDRRDAFEQLQSSKWRLESLVRRDWDGTLSATSSSQTTHKSNTAANYRRSFDDPSKLSRKVLLNPPNDYILREGDELVVLAQDDDTYAPKPFSLLPKSCQRSFIQMEPSHRPIRQTRAERFLLCGWRRDMDDMIMELDELVGKGSEVTLMSTIPIEERNERFRQGGLEVDDLVNLTIHHVVGNPFLRRDLNRIKSQLCSFNSVLILAEQSLETNVPSADSRSLASLLLIRDMICKSLHQQQHHFKPQRESSFRSEDKKRMVSLGSGSDQGGSFRGEIPRSISPDNNVSIEEATTPVMLRRISQSDSKRNLLPRSGSTSSFANSSHNLLKTGDFFVKRLSAVGAALFFENAHRTGNTVLISEILDSRTKALIPVANVGDHVMSNEIVAATLAMVSECRDINVILSELLQAVGNDLHLRSALDYGRVGEKIDFWTLQARARSRGEICIGYRSMGDKGPTLNPREKCAKFTLNPRGMVIVISED